MAYEILHGNVRETYKTIINTIPKDWDLNIPLEFETLLSYDSSGIHNYCMMPVLTPEGMMLLRTVCAPKRKALSTSYFVHKQVLPCTAEALHSSFEEKLGAPFYSEEDFDRIADNEHPVQPSQRWAGDEVSIDPQVLRSVLHGIINRWRSGRAVVAVGVPEGFDYDRYCYGAIRKIYGYLPALIRGMAGFMTYPGSDEIPLDVALVFRPEGTGDRLLSLDHETELSRSFLDEYIPDPFKNMIDTILKRDEAQRAEYLDMIFRYVEKSENENAFTEVKPSHYIKFLEYQDIFEKVRTQEQFDRQVEICGKLDALAEQMRRQFLDGLNERIPLDMLDAFGLSLSQEVDTFQAYVEHIASVDQLVSHSTALLEHTKSKLWEAFRAALDNKPLPELQIQLQNLDKNNPPSFYAQCAEEMARELHDRIVHKDRWDAFNRIDQFFTQLQIPETSKFLELHGFLDEKHVELENLLREVAVEPGDHQARFAKLREDTFKSWIAAQAVLQVGENASKEAYDREHSRVYNVRCDVYIKERKDLADPLDKAMEEIQKLRQDSKDPVREAVLHAAKHPDYFRAIKELGELFATDYDLYSPYLKECKETLDSKRPKNLEDYKKGYRKVFEHPLTVMNTFHLNRHTQEFVMLDLQDFRTAPKVCVTDKKTLIDLLESIAYTSGTMEDWGKPLEEIVLCCETESGPEKFSFRVDPLLAALRTFSSESSLKFELNDQEWHHLLTILSKMHLDPHNRLNVLWILVEQNCSLQRMQRCKDLVLSYCLDDPDFYNQLMQTVRNTKYAAIFTSGSAIKQSPSDGSGEQGDTDGEVTESAAPSFFSKLGNKTKRAWNNRRNK